MAAHPSARLAAAGINAAALALCTLLALLAAPALDQRLLDAQFALNRAWFPQPVQTDVVLVGIDEGFLDTVEEPLTLSHRYLAAFLDAASEAGARVIALDLVLPEKRFDTLISAREPDFDFHRTLLAGLMRTLPRSKLVLAKVWDTERSHYRDIQIDYAAVLATQQDGVQALASALFCSDDDTRIRRYPDPAWNCLPDRSPYTLSSEISAAMGKRQQWSGLINYQIGPAFRYLPLQEVLRLAERGGKAQLRAMFDGKAVLVGTVQDDTDLLNLPAAMAAWREGRRLPGVLVHAQAVRSMLNQGLIQPLGPAWAWGMAAAGALFWFHAAVARKVLLAMLASAALLAASNILLRQGVWIAPSAMLASMWLAVLSRSADQGWRNFSEKQRLRRTFSGYVSPQVMQQIVEGGVDARKQGAKVEVCVLFSDIRNFTSMSELLPAEQVVALLNRYFGRITAMVHRHGGTVDKFIGDGMMAFFGAPNELPSPELAALEAARDMLAELAQLNAELRAEGKAELAMGIGLHSGPAVIGYIGSSHRHEYTAIGDTVNVASRLEGLCKQLGYPIICSGAVAERLGPDGAAMLSPLGEHGLKGHSAVPVYGWDPQGERAAPGDG